MIFKGKALVWALLFSLFEVAISTRGISRHESVARDLFFLFFLGLGTFVLGTCSVRSKTPRDRIIFCTLSLIFMVFLVRPFLRPDWVQASRHLTFAMWVGLTLAQAVLLMRDRITNHQSRITN